MSLYHEAAKVLASSQAGDTSIKSLVYSKKGWKSDPKTLFALSTEAAKWSEVLSEVVERSGLLNAEKQVRDLTGRSKTIADLSSSRHCLLWS